MSLATRCTSCGTIFRVVQDQLKVSEGWVRCGRCDAVFNAGSGLFDLEREAPPEWRPPAPAEAPAAAPEEPAAPVAPAYATESERRWFEAVGGSEVPEVADLQAGRQPDRQAATPPGPVSPPRDAVNEGHELAAVEMANGATVPASHWPERDEPDTINPWAPVDASPGFVEQARREAFWHSRRSRAVLWAASLLLLLALALQGVRQFSELIAARVPAVRPALAAWCQATGCSVAPPHRIDDIVVESTALSPGAPAGALRLAISLRNRAVYPVAMPSIDFTLTDLSGKMIARRVLSPADFAVSATAIQASGDLALQALLTAGNAHVSGYTVEIFYP